MNGQSHPRIVGEEELADLRRRKEEREAFASMTVWQRLHWRASHARPVPYPKLDYGEGRIPAGSSAWAEFLGAYEKQARQSPSFLKWGEQIEAALIAKYGDCFAEKG